MNNKLTIDMSKIHQLELFWFTIPQHLNWTNVNASLDLDFSHVVTSPSGQPLVIAKGSLAQVYQNSDALNNTEKVPCVRHKTIEIPVPKTATARTAVGRDDKNLSMPESTRSALIEKAAVPHVDNVVSKVEAVAEPVLIAPQNRVAVETVEPATTLQADLVVAEQLAAEQLEGVTEAVAEDVTQIKSKVVSEMVVKHVAEPDEIALEDRVAVEMVEPATTLQTDQLVAEQVEVVTTTAEELTVSEAVSGMIVKHAAEPLVMALEDRVAVAAVEAVAEVVIKTVSDAGSEIVVEQATEAVVIGLEDRVAVEPVTAATEAEAISVTDSPQLHIELSDKKDPDINRIVDTYKKIVDMYQ